jgi:hypothetical protein
MAIEVVVVVIVVVDKMICLPIPIVPSHIYSRSHLIHKGFGRNTSWTDRGRGSCAISQSTGQVIEYRYARVAFF